MSSLLLSQRFGSALVNSGQLHLKQKQFAKDFQPIDKDCTCSTCHQYTRAYLNSIVNESVSCTLISVHNIAFQVSSDQADFFFFWLSVTLFKIDTSLISGLQIIINNH